MKSLALLALFFALALAEVATLRYADSPTAVAGSYIVVLKEELDALDRDAHILSLKDQILSSRANAEVTWVYGIGKFKGFAARLTPELLKAELAHPDVQYIEQDQTVSINYQKAASPRAEDVITQTGATWGLDRTSKRNLPLNQQYKYNASAGENTDVYVIDTGVQTTHQEFEGRAAWAFSAYPNEPNTDANGHGTHVAGTIAGVTYGIAKKAQIFAVKVLSASGSGTVATVVAGINYVTQNKRATRSSVANMSLGGGISDALDQAVRESLAANVLYAIAAGNSNANACTGSPSRVAEAVVVGATTDTDARASFSNYGNCVAVFAPGQSITSAWIGSNSAINTISGTSMASPHVAGVLALYTSSVGTVTAAQGRAFISDTATPGKVTVPGTGSPNLLLYSATA